MKLLVVTQAVDLDNPGLGFFHRWLTELSSRVDFITVICLEKGRYDLPDNVSVLSLGKEEGRSRFKYIRKFYSYIWHERKNYDAVFVHMNQEYVLLGGPVWKMLGKRVLMWRNHPLGNILTRLAVGMSSAVFCTSPFAYTAKFKKTKLMPVGIDTENFTNTGGVREHGLLMFGRIDPIKKPEVLLEALGILKQKDIHVPAFFVGSFHDGEYESKLKGEVERLEIGDMVGFAPAVTQKDAPGVLSSYDIYTNATPTGSMDKAIFEAMATETLILTSNKALADEIPAEHIFEEGSPENLARKAVELLKLSDEEKILRGTELRKYVVANHSLDALFRKLVDEFRIHA